MSVLLEVIQQPPNLKSRIQEIASASSAYRLPCFPSTRRLAAAAAAAIAAHLLPAPLAARAQPVTASRHRGHTDVTAPPPPLSYRTKRVFFLVLGAHVAVPSATG